MRDNVLSYLRSYAVEILEYFNLIKTFSATFYLPDFCLFVFGSVQSVPELPSCFQRLLVAVMIWYMTPNSLVHGNYGFERTTCLHLMYCSLPGHPGPCPLCFHIVLKPNVVLSCLYNILTTNMWPQPVLLPPYFRILLQLLANCAARVV